MYTKSLLALSAIVVAVVGAPILKARNSGEMTYYDPTGTGACGTVYSSSDYVIALNTADYDNGAHCGAKVTVSGNGVTSVATVLDECAGCGSGGIDATTAFFEQFASTSVGEISVTWNFD